MKHKDNPLIRKLLYVASMKERSIAEIETLLRDVEATRSELDRQVAAEEMYTRVTDPTHRAYSMAAIAARTRSNNLKQSDIELRAKLRVAISDYQSILAQLPPLVKAKSWLSPSLCRERNADVATDRRLGGHSTVPAETLMLSV